MQRDLVILVINKLSEVPVVLDFNMSVIRRHSTYLSSYLKFTHSYPLVILSLIISLKTILLMSVLALVQNEESTKLGLRPSLLVKGLQVVQMRFKLLLINGSILEIKPTLKARRVVLYLILRVDCFPWER